MPTTQRAPKIETTTVKVTEKHDRLGVKVTMPGGQTLSFTITRSSERVAGTATDEQLRAVQAWMGHRAGENHGQRIERLRALCEGAKSVAEIVARMAGTLWIPSSAA